MSRSLGERIALRRQELGWSQIQLAHAAGLTPSAISLFESGKRKPSFEALRKLAEALRVPADFLTDDDPAPRTSVIRDPRLETIIEGFRILDGAGRDQLVELTYQLLARRAGGGPTVLAEAETRRAARAVISRLNIAFPPVDPFLVACLLGVTVRTASLTEADCEAILDRSGGTPLLLLAQASEGEDGRFNLNENRLRFTVAHSLAHVLLADHQATSYRCRPFAAGVGRPAEEVANSFAAELLMPEPLLAKEYGKLAEPGLEEVKRLAARFKVSIPVGALQYARYAPFPCASILTEGGMIRQVAVSDSFPYRLGEQVPPGALCLTTRGQKGNQQRPCLDTEWAADGRGALLTEEAYHYWIPADQSVTLLTVPDDG